MHWTWIPLDLDDYILKHEIGVFVLTDSQKCSDENMENAEGIT